MHYIFKIKQTYTHMPLEVIQMKHVSTKINLLAAYKTDEANKFFVVVTTEDLSEDELNAFKSRLQNIGELEYLPGKSDADFLKAKEEKNGKYKYFFDPEASKQ